MVRFSQFVAAIAAVFFFAGCGGTSGSPGSGNSATVLMTTASIPDGTTGVAYTAQLEGFVPHDPGVFYVTGGALPPGLKLDPNTGVVAGFPRQVGGFHIEFAMRDGVDASLPPGRDATFAEDRKSFNVRMALGPPHILPQTPPPAQYRASYGYQIDVAGGTAPYTFAQTGGTLPAGLSVTSSGFIGSFPTAVQATPYQFQVTVTDAQGLTDTATLSLQVIVLPLILFTSNPIPQAALGFPYDLTLALASGGGGPPYTWTQAPVGPGETNLASIGMQITTNGHLSGISGGPTALGTYTFTIQVTDEPLQLATRQLTLTVNPGPVLTGISPSRSSTPGPYTVTGLNFQPGATLIFKPGPTQTTVNPTFVSATTLTISGTIPVPGAGSVPVMVRNPDGGNFTKPAAYLFPATNLAFGTKGFVTSTLSSTGLDLADVNGDAFADIVHAGTSGQTVFSGSVSSTNAGLIFHKNAALATPAFSTVTLDGASCYDCKFADVNLDGKQDVVGLFASSIKVFLGDGTGGFGAAITSFLPSGFSWPSEMWIERYNSDVIPDIAFSVSNWPTANLNGRVYTMLGTGTGSFNSADSAISSLPITYGVISLAAGDSDGDGRAEVIAGVGMGDYINSTPCAYSATSSTGFFTGWAVRGPLMNGNGINPYYASSTGITAGDFLGIGSKQVMVFTSGSTYSVYQVTHLFSGAGYNTATKWPSTATRAKCCTAFDGDFDPKMECAVTTTPSQVQVYRGSTATIVATLDAAAGTPTITTPQVGRVAAGDVNGDGLPDLVATTSYWQTNGMAANYGSSYSMANTGNGGQLGLVYWLNSSN
jgi:hypothetical protein